MASDDLFGNFLERVAQVSVNAGADTVCGRCGNLGVVPRAGVPWVTPDDPGPDTETCDLCLGYGWFCTHLEPGGCDECRRTTTRLVT